MSDVLCCAKCQQQLKVVCDAHGTEWTPDRQRDVAPEMSPPAKGRKLTEGTQVARIIGALSADERVPSSVADVQRALGGSAKHIGIQLSILAKKGRVRRISRGLYVRTCA